MKGLDSTHKTPTNLFKNILEVAFKFIHIALFEFFRDVGKYVRCNSNTPVTESFLEIFHVGATLKENAAKEAEQGDFPEVNDMLASRSPIASFFYFCQAMAPDFCREDGNTSNTLLTCARFLFLTTEVYGHRVER
ncbi:hypothetical protein [Paenibacillus apiarius]|uniref:Uncharacterized protein n=1 Tax=Paenibacillus apiarius TaxID=46240 RepID=A0ABT4DX17_9BACL|nr:hypothetical protein [Paenibacillus apiarius]MCY9515893.1 hypothetical protein [Paenibacillus apiarius]MCY9520803.1 hypothetical protein [Paenibacillus apiarius]MCY9553507.1 hypothetical protein [Paenibacillus apiarius]MCY9557969.1 hypothetical protein [Paenibacillus apiarius]MCY9685824.1 hypothetical protein [Paenibacillus apiarius]